MNTCESCGAMVREVYQRIGDRAFVCAHCLPERQARQYPGWRERMAAAERRAEVAKKNLQGVKHGGE